MSDEHAALWTALGKRLGVGAYSNPSVEYYQTTGSLVLDMETRNWKERGGLPGGKYVDCYGKPGAGKSATGCRIGAEVQKQGGLFVYVSTNEQGFNPEFGRLCGVQIPYDNSRTPHWAHLNVFSLNSLWDALEIIVFERMDAKTPTFILIDSISGASVDKATMDNSKAKDTQAATTGAKFLHEGFRRGLLYYSGGSKITIMGIRHQTQSPAMYAGDTVTHGSAPEYYSWLQLKVSCSELEDKKTGEVTGSWIKLKIRRSKIGIKGGEVSMPFYFKTGFNQGLEVIQLLIDTGQLEAQKDKNGKVTGRYILNDTALQVYELVESYDSSTAVQEQLQNMVLDMHGVDRAVLKAKKKVGKGK